MGCIYACSCGGICVNCNEYKEEEYFGHAEDLVSQARGFRDMEEEQEYYARKKTNLL